MSKSLAQLLPKISRTALKGSTSKQVVVWQNWSYIFGEIAPRIIPYKITSTQSGTLIVHADSMTALQIQYQEPQILERISQLAGPGLITRIKTIKGHTHTTTSPRHPAMPVTPPTPPAQTLDEALANLEKVLK